MADGQLKARTRAFGLAILRLSTTLPQNEVNRILLRQLVRSATSVGANYRSAQRAQSIPDMIAKLKRVEEEADESEYWLDLLAETNSEAKLRLDELRSEANQILAMVVASINTLRSKDRAP